MDNQPAIVKVEKLYKSFHLPHEKHNGIKQALISMFRGKKGYEIQRVLNDISFEIKKGEFFGIVGRNGSGKSTLLKLLAGIYTPDKGDAHIAGTVTPFIELGVGFNPELTGRDNVYLNSALLGMSRDEVDKIYDQIVHFAELDKFMDQKLKNYSSGMQVRLAFSIAIRAKSDVLIMDEVLAVGDASFQKKCFDVFRKLKAEGRTIILVTHDMGNVEKFCDRVLILDKGKILDITTPPNASSIYGRLNVDERENEKQDALSQSKVRLGSNEVTVKEASLSHNSKRASTFKLGESLTLELELERKADFKSYPVCIGLAIYNEDGIVVAGPNANNANLDPAATTVSYTIPKLPFRAGEYVVTIVIYDKDAINRFDYLEKWLHFSIISDHGVAGIVETDDKWESK